MGKNGRKSGGSSEKKEASPVGGDKKNKKNKKDNKKKEGEAPPKRVSSENRWLKRVDHIDRVPEKKLRRMLRSNHPSEAFLWAERGNFFAILREISKESTSVGEAARDALASNGNKRKMSRKTLVHVLRNNSPFRAYDLAERGENLDLLREIAREEKTIQGRLARASIKSSKKES